MINIAIVELGKLGNFCHKCQSLFAIVALLLIYLYTLFVNGNALHFICYIVIWGNIFAFVFIEFCQGPPWCISIIL